MRDIWGLLVALLALALVWVWFTGRANNVWSAISGQSVPSGTGSPASTTTASQPGLVLASNVTPQGLPTQYASLAQVPSILSAYPSLSGTPASSAVGQPYSPSASSYYSESPSNGESQNFGPSEFTLSNPNTSGPLSGIASAIFDWIHPLPSSNGENIYNEGAGTEVQPTPYQLNFIPSVGQYA